MELEIKNSLTIADVQKAFNNMFPYLKLEFFSTQHQDNKPSPKSMMYPHNTKLSRIRTQKTEGELHVEPTDLVADVEQSLWERFGISAQVFRKSGNLWIETSLTDSWTLKQQNDEGREFSSGAFRDQEKIDLTDRDKWE